MNQQRPPFRKIWDLGYNRLVPIVPPDAAVSEKSALAKRPESKGKAPGVKGDDGLWRGLNWLNHKTTEADLELWADMGAGIGIRTGHGLIALDIDSTNDLIAHQAIKLAHEMLGPAPHRIGRWPKAILIYRTSDELPYQRVEFTGGKANERIELLTEGRQFVAYGIHPGVKKPYEWPDGISNFDKLSTVTGSQVDAYFAKLATLLPAASRPLLSAASSDRKLIDQNRLTGNLELVQRAVDALPNTTDLFPTYDDYIRVGAAIKGASQADPSAGLELFLAWALKWDGGNEEEQAEADYHRIKPPYELGAKWLYDMADRYNPTAFSLTDHWFEPITDSREPLFPQQGLTPNSNRKFTQVPFHEAAVLAKANFAKPLIKGFLDQGAASVIYGASNSGKTFIALDIAYHIATGKAWAGMKTPTGGLPALYVATEGGNGIRKRAAAITARHRTPTEPPFHLIMASVNLFDPNADTGPLIDACKDMSAEVGMPGFIVIDTLARSMAGGDENSAKDMTQFVNNIDRIREATRAHVMIVHHSGKDATRGARGSGALLAAVDTEIEIADNTVHVTKQRDLDKEFSVRFALDIIPLGNDEDGDPITSCTVRLLDNRDVVVGIATPKEMDVLSALDVLENLNSAAASGVSMTDIVSFMDSRPDKMGKEAVRFHLKALAAKGLIVRVGRGKWAQKSGGSLSSALIEEVDEDEQAEESGGKAEGNVFH